jgi:hypothetical protein
MLSELEQEMILEKVRVKYAEDNNGEDGFAEDDIINEVLFLGGDMTDVYQIMILAMDELIKLNDEEDIW